MPRIIMSHFPCPSDYEGVVLLINISSLNYIINQLRNPLILSVIPILITLVIVINYLP